MQLCAIFATYNVEQLFHASKKFDVSTPKSHVGRCTSETQCASDDISPRLGRVTGGIDIADRLDGLEVA